MKGVEAFTKAELAELEILAAKWVSLENPRAHEYDAYKAAQALSDLQDAALGKISANPLRLLATIERQGKALRAVAELVQRWRRDIDPANQVDKNDPFYDEGIEDSADELEKTLKAALAQTEPQTERKP